MNNQGSVEWLQLALVNTILTHEQVMQTIGLFEQAKGMQQEQMIDFALWHASRMRNAYQTDNKYYANQSFELWLQGENKIPDYLIFHQPYYNWGVRDINDPSKILKYYETYEEAKIACLKQIQESEQ